jgi:uncharacterized protein YxjI
MALLTLSAHANLLVHQRHEVGEFLGFEGRNKYEVLDERKQVVAFAAEQRKGLLDWFARQFLGHWRRYEIRFFDPQRRPFLVARHPFRLIFQRLEVYTDDGRFLGALQQRFSILTKRFDVEGPNGQTILEVSSPFWKIWTFPFMHGEKRVACISKKWSGILSEAFTDKDNFLVQYEDQQLSEEERHLLLAAAVFIDLRYFERKAGRN